MPFDSPAPPAGAGEDATRLLARVETNRSLGSLVWLTLAVHDWATARPGQFVLLQAVGSCRFLGRALSVARQQRDSVSFLVAPVGDGTRELAALDEGEQVWVLGPLGNGFDLPSLAGGAGRIVVVAGGVGAAPFPLLLSRLADARDDGGSAGVLVLLGFRDAAQAAGAQPVLEEARLLAERGVACRVELVTEDGSIGRAERVSNTLERELRPGDRLAVCGPPAMTRAIARTSSKVADVRAWFSLEAGMACGVGSCHGCVIPLEGGNLARVCREGPVFEGETLFGRGHAGAHSVAES
jgi:dihydroorotate dehydrogenase electron transfer subunit